MCKSRAISDKYWMRYEQNNKFPGVCHFLPFLVLYTCFTTLLISLSIIGSRYYAFEGSSMSTLCGLSRDMDLIYSKLVEILMCKCFSLKVNIYSPK